METSHDFSIRNRVVERQRMNVAALAVNQGNWREHPDGQRSALEGILEDVGQVGELYAYHSERNGGALTLIDGHLRRELGGEWDVAITDLDDAEADKLLLTYDSITGMALANRERAHTLLQTIETRHEKVSAMLEEIGKRFKPVLSTASDQSPEPDEQFAILIECASEKQQAELLDRLTREGWKCRSLIA